MRCIDKVVVTALLLAVNSAGIRPPEALGQSLGVSALRSQALAVPEYTSLPVIDRTQEDRVYQALQKSIDCNLHEVKLAELVDFIRRQTGVQSASDDKNLEDAGITADSVLFSLTASQIPARTALRLLLDQYEMTFVVKSSVLLITTKDIANMDLDARVYPVADLVYSDQDGLVPGDFDSLIELITTTISPQTWDEVGGPSSVGVFTSRSALVISQTPEIHEEVAGLLEALRRLPSVSFSDIRAIYGGVLRRRSHIHRLVPLQGGASSSATSYVPAGNPRASREQGGGMFNVEPAPAIPAKSTLARSLTVQANASRYGVAPQHGTYPKWRTPQNHDE